MLYCHRYVQGKKDFTSSVILFSFAPYIAFCLVKTSVDRNIVQEALVIDKYSVFSYFSNKAILLNTSARVPVSSVMTKEEKNSPHVFAIFVCLQQTKQSAQLA